jgi:hypothetical protein
MKVFESSRLRFRVPSRPAVFVYRNRKSGMFNR